MSDFNYNETIEYIDGTYDKNFSEAQKWALSHFTTFEEDMSKRDLPKRYFVIGDEPKPYVPTEDEMKQEVRGVRDSYLLSTDFTQLVDAPLSDEEKETYRKYRQYLRDYTNQENWWEENPKTFNEWNIDNL